MTFWVGFSWGVFAWAWFWLVSKYTRCEILCFMSSLFKLLDVVLTLNLNFRFYRVLLILGHFESYIVYLAKLWLFLLHLHIWSKEGIWVPFSCEVMNKITQRWKNSK